MSLSIFVFASNFGDHSLNLNPLAGFGVGETMSAKVFFNDLGT